MLNILRSYLLYFLTTALSFLLILSNQNPQGVALRGRMLDIITIAAFPVSTMVKGVRVWKENERLRNLLSQMSLEMADNIESSIENVRLREMLDFKRKPQYHITATEVIGMSSDPGLMGIIINKGSRDSIAVNQAVFTTYGIVGRVQKVGLSSAMVQLLTDPNIGIAGRLLKSREQGIIHAGLNGQLVLNGVPITAEVSIGDTVVSSGLGGVFPPGLMIGVTTTVEAAANGWLWDIMLKPSVNFGRLEEVFVVLGEYDAQ